MSASDLQFSRYRALVSHLAEQTLTAAAQLAPPPARVRGTSLAAVLPAARAVMAPDDAAVSALDGPMLLATLASERQWITLTGQQRPVYHPLAAHLVLRAVTRQRQTLNADQWAGVRTQVHALAAALEPGTPTRETLAVALWQHLARLEAAALTGDEPLRERAMHDVAALLAQSPAEGPLHSQAADDQLDHWTYRELSGLHALANLALHAPETRWWQVVHRVARFHVEHTQPDYTTYEPWAVHAFLRWPKLAVFAEQQLHDTQTNLHVTGDEASLLPALLLADAAAALRDPAFGAPRDDEADPA